MAKSLLGTLPIYAQHLAEQTGVKVVVGGKTAWTNGTQVTVPFSEDDLPLTFGFIAHECSHVRNTDMAVFAEAAVTPFRKNMLNVLEDIRIERLSMDQYPGTESDIRYLNRKVLLDPFKPEHLAQCDDKAIIHNAILFGAYWKLQEPQLEKPAKAFLDAFQALLGQELADKIMAKALSTLQCDSTRDVLELVDAIIAMLPSNEDEQQPEPKSDSEPEQGEEEGKEEADKDGESQPEPQGDGDEQSDDSGSSGTGNDESEPSGEQKSAAGDADDGEQEGESGDGSDGAGKPEPEQKTSAEGQGESTEPQNAGQAQPSAGQGTPKGLREQVLEATEEDLKGLISEVGDAAAEMLSQNAAQNSHLDDPFPLGGRSSRRSDDASQRRRNAGEMHSSGLRQILNGLLQAQVDCRVRLKRQGKRIDTSRIAMLVSGETRVFRSKARAERQSAAIQFLFDKSGSMQHSMDEAEAALYAVLRSLEGLPLVTSGAMSFPGSESGQVSNSCDLIKRSTERLAAAVQARGFGSLALGGTPLLQAIWPAAVEVLRAKGERKILFVITDGSPNEPASKCRQMFERCEASGIEVIGLGFGEANSYVLSQLFSKYVAVGTASNLKRALFGVVREALAA